jgi:hypothetical protein
LRKKKKKKLQELDHVIININNRKKTFKTDSECMRERERERERERT